MQLAVAASGVVIGQLVAVQLVLAAGLQMGEEMGEGIDEARVGAHHGQQHRLGVADEELAQANP